MNSTELVPIDQRPPPAELAGILAADTPEGVIERAAEVASPLAKLIDDRKLCVKIKGKRHVTIDGWTTLCAMLGCTVREVNVIENDGEFTATVELARCRDNRVISRASASCGPDEPTWKSRSRQARRSMAITRAASKVCRLAFSWIIRLSGYSATPAEEIDADPAEPPVANTRRGGDTKPAVVIDTRFSSDDGDPSTSDQREHIKKLVKSLGMSKDTAKTIVTEHGATRLAELTVGTAADIIRKLEFQQTTSDTPF